jgi:hypothetical protein
LLIYIAISAILSSVSNLIYEPLISTLTKISSNKIQSLRFSITILFIAITCAMAGLVFNIKTLTDVSLGLIGLQIISIPLTGFLFVSYPVEDVKIEPNQIWSALGKMCSIISIITFVLDFILPFLANYRIF